ncbi:hypothetical protein AMC99_02496 [Altererythrobacter epoxidivorans]|uniref:Uncharacterized protein n=2 Tax=Altererythrobacter epoxidivorans TaxID=361183 RepID=A0A0M5L394_9SPHN|nr:hypothetical protein AMC99_02496 [Altererythrobacter epoxidivorans]
MTGLDSVISPDMQKLLAFLLPVLFAIGTLVMNLSRGFTIGGYVLIAIFTALAIYFMPGFASLF